MTARSAEAPEERISIEFADGTGTCPGPKPLRRWVENALDGDDGGLDLRVVGREEMQDLNRSYRDRDHATNVLSFPAELHPAVPVRHLGDLVICAPVVREEARAQGKAETDHWAHLVTHGVLHLLGFDHIEDEEAQVMESRERELLARLGIDDPYE